MKIGHISDLHGDYRPLMHAPEPDIWVSTGDMFGSEDVAGQHVHSNYHMVTIKMALRNKPVLVINGNHDRICWGDKLREHGINAINITETPQELFGLRWAGFREVPPINGRFVAEESQEKLKERYTRVLAQDFDVLVTHCPSHGILSEYNWGVDGLADAILSRSSPLKAHLFGHHHLIGGQKVVIRNTLFSNAARSALILEI